METLDNVKIDTEVIPNHSAMLNDHFKQIETYQVRNQDYIGVRLRVHKPYVNEVTLTAHFLY